MFQNFYVGSGRHTPELYSVSPDWTYRQAQPELIACSSYCATVLYVFLPHRLTNDVFSIETYDIRWYDEWERIWKGMVIF
jgi:hypothetical protein